MCECRVEAVLLSGIDSMVYPKVTNRPLHAYAWHGDSKSVCLWLQSRLGEARGTFSHKAHWVALSYLHRLPKWTGCRHRVSVPQVIPTNTAEAECAN